MAPIILLLADILFELEQMAHITPTSVDRMLVLDLTDSTTSLSVDLERV